MERREGDGGGGIEDAVASAAALMLRHRLFPRAMAWTIQQSVERVDRPSEGDATGRFPAPPPPPARQNSASDRDKPTPTLEDVARSFPLLQAVDIPAKSLRRGSASSGSIEMDGEHHRREKLLRAVGKFLGDGERPQTAKPTPQPLPLTIHRVPVDEDQQHAAFQAMTISAYSDNDSIPSRGTTPSPTTRTEPSTSRRAVQARPRSPAAPTSSIPPRSSSGKKRTRGESTRRERERVDPATMEFPKTKTPIAPSLARALVTGYGAKRCSADECGKIAVSKGLCRGHGGGRRCTALGCNKCAQSRSPFCWAHGGGKRCEAPGCRRSRKTKRFCVDHVEMEATVPLPPPSAPPTPPRHSPTASPSSASQYQVPFPPLKRQMSGDFGLPTVTGGDSDDSTGGRSTITTDSDVSSVYTSSFTACHNKENTRGANAGASSMAVDYENPPRRSKHFSAQDLQGHGYHSRQDAGEQTSAFSPVIVGLQGDNMAGMPPPLAGPRGVSLPSLSEVLMRAVPATPHGPPSAAMYASFASSTMVFSHAEGSAPSFPSRERPW